MTISIAPPFHEAATAKRQRMIAKAEARVAAVQAELILAQKVVAKTKLGSVEHWLANARIETLDRRLKLKEAKLEKWLNTPLFRVPLSKKEVEGYL